MAKASFCVRCQGEWHDIDDLIAEGHVWAFKDGIGIQITNKRQVLEFEWLIKKEEMRQRLYASVLDTASESGDEE